MSAHQQVIIEIKNHIGWIKLNRLDALNALSLEMIETISQTLIKWKEQEDIYMIYLTSNHPKSFCAGGDVKSLYEHSISNDMAYPKLYLSKQYTMDYMIQTYPKPILTYIDGYVFGGGVGLSIGSSFVVVSNRVKFAMPETKIGFFPDVGASYFLNKLFKYTGRYIGILGQILNESDLMYLNIADYVIHHDLWKNVEEELFKTKLVKEDIDHMLSSLLSKYHKKDVKKSEIETHIKSIEKIFSKSTLSEMLATIDEKSTFEMNLKHKFLEMSPTAMATTLEMLKRTTAYTLFECLKFEQCLSDHIILTHDFKEGVRSLLVDKDRRFDYQPKHISDLDLNDIDDLFEFDLDAFHMMDDLVKAYEN